MFTLQCVSSQLRQVHSDLLKVTLLFVSCDNSFQFAFAQSQFSLHLLLVSHECF